MKKIIVTKKTATPLYPRAGVIDVNVKHDHTHTHKQDYSDAGAAGYKSGWLAEEAKQDYKTTDTYKRAVEQEQREGLFMSFMSGIAKAFGEIAAKRAHNKAMNKIRKQAEPSYDGILSHMPQPEPKVNHSCTNDGDWGDYGCW